MAEDLGERTERPTGRRLEEARSNGNLARSTDLGAAIDLTGAAIILVFFGGALVRGMLVVMRRTLGERTDDLVSLDAITPLLQFTLGRAAIALLPILLVMMAVAYLAQLLQVGWSLSTKPLEPKLNRLNFVANFAQFFGKRNIVKTLVNSIKLTVVLFLGWKFLARGFDRLAALPSLDLWAVVSTIGTMILNLAIWLLLILLVIGLADWVYQRWQHTQDLKMTKQEVQDERRSMDGDPKIKAKRFRMFQEIVYQRARHAVPEADVIVTNPTHYSVAIKYDTETMAAPRVTAKGVDHLALRIRQIAAANSVPIIERPPLARALYYGVEIGQEISPRHYQAVAEILAYVYRLENLQPAA